MSPARKAQDVEEPDRVEGQPHPREVYELIGQDDALARASRIIRSGRPPHGLMLAGPAGIGKATLAYRIAPSRGAGESRTACLAAAAR